MTDRLDGLRHEASELADLVSRYAGELAEVAESMGDAVEELRCSTAGPRDLDRSAVKLWSAVCHSTAVLLSVQAHSGRLSGIAWTARALQLEADERAP